MDSLIKEGVESRRVSAWEKKEVAFTATWPTSSRPTSAMVEFDDDTEVCIAHMRRTNA